MWRDPASESARSSAVGLLLSELPGARVVAPRLDGRAGAAGTTERIQAQTDPIRRGVETNRRQETRACFLRLAQGPDDFRTSDLVRLRAGRRLGVSIRPKLGSLKIS